MTTTKRTTTTTTTATTTTTTRSGGASGVVEVERVLASGERIAPETFVPTWSAGELKRLLDGDWRGCPVAVLGDFCLDVYWTVEPEVGPDSVETGKPTQRARQERCEPGGAGSVAMNLAALGCAVSVFGVVGEDLWGRELQRLLEGAGIDVGGLLVGKGGWATPVHVKPFLDDEEQERFDLGMEGELGGADADRLMAALAAKLPEASAAIVSEHLGGLLFTPRLRAALGEKIRNDRERRLFVVNSRNFVGEWTGAGAVCINAREAARAVGEEVPRGAAVPGDLAARAALELYRRNGGGSVFVTRGDRGCLVADQRRLWHVPARQLLGKTDAVGAGDAMTAAVALATARGGAASEAAALGTLAASVTAGKRRQTGTATAAEIVAVVEDADFIYYPDLADDLRAAKVIEGTAIEIVSGRAAPTKVTHAIFDHDGTISTLREGWEAIMEPMMVRAILGAQFETADSLTYRRIVERSRDFIDKTTGIQTLIQMQGLATLVREYGYVPEGEVLDEHRYKRIYNDELIKMVAGRAERLKKGELEPRDYAMKGAIELLHALKKAGVVLYLASGTDEPDVKAEAAAMGYADLFEGHIYGSTGDVTKDAKKMVLDRILSEIGAEAMGRLIMLGDGPVEIRETKKRGGFTIGVASDEVRRFGMNAGKRTRVIRAGCDWLVADFAQVGKILELLNVGQ